MRIWDLPPRLLCDRHLLGEHRELHAIWTVITRHRQGYSRHPETLRWHGRLRALFLRHKSLLREFARRGFRHASPLDARRATGSARQSVFVNTRAEQRERLRAKGCACRV